MARLRYNGLTTELGSSLSSGATSVSFASPLTHSGGVSVPTVSGSDYVPLSLLDGDGRVAEIVYLTAYTSGATSGTVTRGREGTTGVAHASGAVVLNAPTVGDFGGLLGSTSYNPAVEVQPALGSSDADVDATNLVVTFVVPPSGAVIFEGSVVVLGTNSTNTLLTARSGSTTLQAQRMVNGSSHLRLPFHFKLSGLTVGATQTLKLGGYCEGAGGAKVAFGGPQGAVVLKVVSA